MLPYGANRLYPPGAVVVDLATCGPLLGRLLFLIAREQITREPSLTQFKFLEVYRERERTLIAYQQHR